ncbi:hypothetical protein, partial [Endozoicomonas sp. YOMI1]|uniref:hypothetical protein n=1 Tax=Endozoicomonas sp. YOMI1 TaxID=2828739 RepID=UPI0021476564
SNCPLSQKIRFHLANYLLHIKHSKTVSPTFGCTATTHATESGHATNSVFHQLTKAAIKGG